MIQYDYVFVELILSRNSKKCSGMTYPYGTPWYRIIFLYWEINLISNFHWFFCLGSKFFLSLYQVKAFGLNGCNMIHSKDFSIICKCENDGNRRTRNHFFNFFLYFSILNMLLVLKSFKTMHQLVYGMRQILQYVALRV